MNVYTYCGAVDGGGLDALVGVVVAAAGKAYLIVRSLGLSNREQTARNAEGGLFCQPYGRSRPSLLCRLLPCGSIKGQLVAVAVAYDAFLYRVVAAAVHRLARNGLGDLLRRVRYAHLNGRVGVVTLIACYVKGNGLEELHLAVVVVVPSCHDDGLVIVAHALALLDNHHGGVQNIALKS